MVTAINTAPFHYFCMLHFL